MRQLSGSDWTMVSLDLPRAHNTIGMVGIYDTSSRDGGPPTEDEVLKYIEARLHVAESFRERMVDVPFGLDRPWWIRDGGFDLEYHVRHIALPRPGSWRQFCTQIARIHARPLDLSRPPWELYLIDGLDDIDHVPANAIAVFLRIHHAAIDAVAGAEILTAIHTHEPDGEPPPPPEGWSWEPDPVPSDAELLRRAAVNGITRPLGLVRTFRRLVPQLPMLAADRKNPDVTSPASLPKATRFNQIVGPHRVFGTSYTTLDVLKEIRAGMPEAKINDIGLAVVGGAIRAYLLEKDELPDESMIAMMPISIRPTKTRKTAIGETESASSSTAGNQFSIAPITMATDEVDPMDRLARIVASTSHVKESGAHPVRALMEMSEEALGGLMGTVQRTAVRTLNRRGRTLAVHTLVSNVPGPITPMYFCGAKMVDTTGLGPVLDGMGLNNGIGSYGGRVTFCFTADRDALPDPERYEACLAGAVDELLEASRARARCPEQAQRQGVTEPGFTAVIGGGGAMAIGISAGIMLALRDVGVDVHDAATCIGTSAGSTVAADLRLGKSFDEIAAAVCTDVGDDEPVESTKAWRSWPELGRRTIGSSWVLMRALSPAKLAVPEPPRVLQRSFPGSLLALGEKQDWATELYPEAWPDGRVWAIAADLDTGRRVVLEADPPEGRPRATLPQALQASCAIPGLYPPVRIDGVRLVDGGLRSATNLDVAAELPQKAVLGISSIAFDPGDPPVGPGRLLRTVPTRQVLREASRLRRLGHEVLMMRPGRAALEVAGTTLLSGRITSDVVEAAYEGATRSLASADVQRRLERFRLAAAETVPIG